VKYIHHIRLVYTTLEDGESGLRMEYSKKSTGTAFQMGFAEPKSETILIDAVRHADKWQIGSI
jgi:hypothetical protein